MRRVSVKLTLSHACINNHHYTDYKHRVYGLSANPFHHSSVIGAVSGNNEGVHVGHGDSQHDDRCSGQVPYHHSPK